MKLESICFLRHGQADHEGFLTERGRPLVDKVAYLLLEEWGLTILDTSLICSDQLRAIKTAQRFNHICQIEEEIHEELFSNDKKCDVQAALDVIASQIEAARNIIVVSHSEMIAALPKAFAIRFLGADLFPYEEVDNAEGFLINCDRKTRSFISWRGIYPTK